jgi:hypothetical protein
MGAGLSAGEEAQMTIQARCKNASTEVACRS